MDKPNFSFVQPKLLKVKSFVIALLMEGIKLVAAMEKHMFEYRELSI